MSKELTEQYHKGTLPCGFYYFTNGKDVYPIHHRQVKGLTAVRGVEVIAEVPTYDQFVDLTEKANQFSQMVKKVEAKEQEYIDCLRHTRNQLTEQILRLEKKLNIATSTLEYYAEGTIGSSVAEQALKEMEEVCPH